MRGALIGPCICKTQRPIGLYPVLLDGTLISKEVLNKIEKNARVQLELCCGKCGRYTRGVDADAAVDRWEAGETAGYRKD